MSFKQTNYAGRLPYGLWIDRKGRTEHIFDRGYCGLASRPIDEPWKVTVHPKRHYIGGDCEVYFYSDATSPKSSPAALSRAERVLGKFVLGHDVRGYLKDQARKPKTDGKYLPMRLRPRDRRIDEIAADDS
ncbi:hypothetical protein SAMN05444000_1125 [Shimia gijangensis]|uniref:Uncharacterized protein n=1 Tax=Shimia gijangensis TaxID=1470563 RepID=A0A1M6LHY8_9RHOB|nr:hypothetical protein [Shimia gijangensis]SHJ70793.1 hypothetical protein SAMN05444000_1125 [Shimia gijangensis]